MRTRRSTVRAVVLLAAMLPLLIAQPALAAPGRVEGLWNLVDEILDGCPTGNTIRTVVDMKLFLRDGTMIETSGSPGVGAPPLKRGTPGLGSWKHLGGRRYALTFQFYRYNGSDDSFAGTQIADVDIEVSQDGKSMTTHTTTDIFDANGVLITSRCTVGTGTRVE